MASRNAVSDAFAEGESGVGRGGMAGLIIAAAARLTQGMTTFKSGIWRRFGLKLKAGWSTMEAVNDDLTPTRSHALAVIMQRTSINNRWASEQWEARGVVRDTSAADSPARVIVEGEGFTQMLFPGHRLYLARDEAEGYYLNLTSPEPKVFILWRPEDDVARPQRMTVSYGEGTRWADSGEQVDGVAIPRDLLPWMAAFIEEHYRPEPPKKKRYASSRDKGRMGGTG
jgi:hypothetical protein